MPDLTLHSFHRTTPIPDDVPPVNLNPDMLYAESNNTTCNENIQMTDTDTNRSHGLPNIVQDYENDLTATYLSAFSINRNILDISASCIKTAVSLILPLLIYRKRNVDGQTKSTISPNYPQWRMSTQTNSATTSVPSC